MQPLEVVEVVLALGGGVHDVAAGAADRVEQRLAAAGVTGGRRRVGRVLRLAPQVVDRRLDLGALERLVLVALDVLLEEEVRHEGGGTELARRLHPLGGPAVGRLRRHLAQVGPDLGQVGERGFVDLVAAVAAHLVDQLAADVDHVRARRPHVVGVTGEAAGLVEADRVDRRLQELLLLPVVLAPPTPPPAPRSCRRVAGAREVGGAIEAGVADGAAELVVGMRRAVAHEQLGPRMGAVRLRPLLAVVAGAVGRLMAGHAAIDAIGGGEVDVVVEARQHHLLDLERRRQEVHQRRVEREVGEVLLERGQPRLAER